jgi:carboxymethylenebutenolidase
MPVPGAVTDPSAVTDMYLTVDSGGTALDAYLARPTAGANNAGIIVIHEAFGPVPHIHDLARRFANIGFNALAPDLYTRVGSPAQGDVGDLFGKMVGLNDSQVVKDLEACATSLRALEGANGKVGCIGFCSGGRQTLLFACSSSKVDAAVDCWGGFITRAAPDAETTPSRPTPVINLAEHLTCPLFLVGGADDPDPAPATLEYLKSRLDQAGKKDVDLEIWDNAGHAFLADYRTDNYREGPANELWPRIVAFFERHIT